MAISYIEERGRLPRRTLGPPRNDISFFLSSSKLEEVSVRAEESAILKTQNFGLKKGHLAKGTLKDILFFLIYARFI